jgi:3-hydroxymyristoyl/3-hydroxydecanoyl-(acyl carrier protein) dehydratase
MHRMSADKWLPLEDVRTSPDGFWESSATYGPSSEWFSGHFDQCPILPGVAFLALTAETVERHGRERGRLLEVTGFSRVRFKRLIPPGERLLISVAPMPSLSEATLDFRVISNGATVVRGLLNATEASPGRVRR